MPEFKGFDDWIPIFRGGKQTDSLGREHDGDQLIDRAVASFDAGRHEPPVCIGHPADNAPAWGWVEGLKKLPQQGGAFLMAKFRQVQPAFADMVKNGLFKKRSAAFYPDGSLRHVAFLGAAPPAVKGLADVAFTEETGSVFEFTDETIKREKEERGMDFKEFIQELKKLIPGAETAAPTGKTFTEADLAERIRTATEEGARTEREKLTAEFAERDRKTRLAARRQEIDSWCGAQVKEGRLTPAMVKFGIPEMLLAFAEREDVIEFGETREKATLFDRFKALIEKEMPKVVTFREVATRDKDIGGADAKEAAIAKFMESNQGVTYKDAVLAVSKARPELFKEEV
jgi:hypothetical protein